MYLFYVIFKVNKLQVEAFSCLAENFHHNAAQREQALDFTYINPSRMRIHKHARQLQI